MKSKSLKPVKASPGRAKRRPRVIRAFTKDIFRSISHSWGRFWAIFAIVALGAGFYAGLRATAPDMRATADAYFDDTNMMDIRLLSAFGFSDEDVEAIGDIPGVKGLMAGHTADVLSVIEGKEQAIRVHSLPEDMSQDNENYINRPVLVEGRFPEKSGECVIGRNKTQSGVKVGDTITISGEDWEDSFKCRTFEVVGMVDSSYYISFSLGSTSIGTGTLNLYMYILDTDFNQEAVTDLYLTVDGASEESTFSGTYEEKVQAVKDALKPLGEERDDIRYEEVTADSRKELEDGWEEYNEAESKAKSELQDAEAELTEAQGKLEESRAELEAGKLEYEEGKARWEEKKLEYDAAREQYEDGRSQWLSGYSEYIAGLQEYSSGMEELRQGKQQLNAAEQELQSAEQQLEASRPLYEAAKRLKEALGQSEASASGRSFAWAEEKDLPEDLEDLLDQAGGLTEGGLKELLGRLSPEEQEELAQYLDSVIATFEENEKQLEAGRKEFQKQKAENEPKLEAAEKELTAAKALLDETKQTLDATKAQLDSASAQLKEGRTQLDEGEKTLLQTEKTLKEGEAQLSSGEKELEAGRKEYDSQKQKAEKELEDAKKELENGERKLSEMDIPEWYILGRDTNTGYASFESDAGRMDSLSTVFPVLFFLVAALVALTTMTRMVEEERVMIGTYKALGYGNGKIAKKYLFYAGLASITGSIAGVCLGFATLPEICWNAYRMMYTAPELVNQFNVLHASVGCALAVLCTLGATWAACRSSLREQPASLMQPKAPKMGKRILLERIPFIWKRLKFTSKVTCRNLFRYKKRLIMTIVGISGCTALVVTGFGIKDSISHIISNQYDDLYVYNFTASLKDGELSEEAKAILNDTDTYSGWMKSLRKMADISAGEETVSGYVVVPENAGALKTYIKLRDRRTHEDVPFGEGSVVLTEKLANTLGVSPGDTVTLENSSGARKAFTVTGITENYVYHYAYIDPKLYEEVMGEKPVSTEVDAVSLLTDEEERREAAQKLLDDDSVATASYTSDVKKGFDDMLQSLNSITLVLIICAGALAFVVLYNLTNINVTERQRELATIKVLGFFNREVGAYIYRETTLLTIMGCALGLVLGVIMNSFVIQTVEVDLVMFPRTIEPLSFVWSALITILFSVIVDLFMNKKLRRIDMVESLKSVE